MNNFDSMTVKNHATYLGEIICSSGSNDKNIQNKRNSGLSAVSQIIAMLNQISLGHFYFEIALVLRDTVLIPKVVLAQDS